MKKWIAKAKQRASDTLEQNRPLPEVLSGALVGKETLSAAEVRKIAAPSLKPGALSLVS